MECKKRSVTFSVSVWQFMYDMLNMLYEEMQKQHETA